MYRSREPGNKRGSELILNQHQEDRRKCAYEAERERERERERTRDR